MKVNRTYLKKIIKEEINNIILESPAHGMIDDLIRQHSNEWRPGNPGIPMTRHSDIDAGWPADLITPQDALWHIAYSEPTDHESENQPTFRGVRRLIGIIELLRNRPSEGEIQ